MSIVLHTLQHSTSILYYCCYSSLVLLSFFFFFFLMILLPPRSTLFPYTTLFRSLAMFAQAISSTKPTAPNKGKNSAVTRDRKSTRLNSSHLGISYAVFCLKKKKKIKKIEKTL